MSEGKIETALVAVVSSKDAADTVANLGEALFDQALSAGLLRDIPIVGTFVGLVRSAGGIRDYMFMKKVAKFAAELDDVSEEERYAFRRDIDADPEFRQKVGENLLLHLERIDDMQKAPLAGRIFAAFLRKRVNRQTMRRLMAALDRAFYPDLQQLVVNGGRGA